MSVEAKFHFSGKLISIEGYSTNDWIFTSIENNKTFYEVDLLKYMRFALRKDDGYILDIGANIGNHSVFFGSVMGKEVACFEPNPPVLKVLRRNLKANNIDSETYSFGLGEHEGHFSIDDNHDGAANNVGAARLCETDNGTIIVKRLDDIIDSVNDRFAGKKLIAIKADIEGMEPAMLKGGLATLEKAKPDVFLEISNDQQMAEIDAILSPLGYKKLYSHAATPVWHFSHKSKMSIIRRIKLALFIGFMKVIEFPGRVLAAIKRRI